MADPGFFVRDEHPARELLNQIAEVGANWLGDEDVDPQLLQRMAQSVRGLLGQDARAPEVFAAASEDVQQHQRAAAHRAELAERRHVEAARGKERWNWPVARPPHRSTSAATPDRHRASCRPCCARPGPMH